MSKYKLKSLVQRGSLLGAAFALFAATLIPSLAYADALNPLTERSLTLSSSSPGWSNTDGSGNSTYAPPNSGANGQKSGNYFSFRVSTDSQASGEPIKAMSFQYCTNPAGDCTAPGDDASATVPGVDDESHSDLNVNYPSAAEIHNTDNQLTGTISLTSSSPSVTGTGTSFTTELKVGGTIKTDGGNLYVIKSIADDTTLTLKTDATATETGVDFFQSDFEQVVDTTTGTVKAVPGYTNNNPKYQFNGGTGDAAEAAKDVAGNFIVMYYDGGTSKWVQSTGWTASTSNQEEAGSGTTGKNNTIILENASGLGLPATNKVKVLFFATTNNYITNPGSGAFFVKINTFKNFTPLAGPTPGPENTLADNVASGDVIDGGVTVANVMNQSIQITTKVLETMQFSVGTVDPNTLSEAQLGEATNGSGAPSVNHQVCDTIKTAFVQGEPQNVLQLGDQTAESSLKTNETYATHSYWRLSSNSSAGATVYYSGHTLSNTSGDEIAPIGTNATASAQGAEQFGLAMATVALPGASGDFNYGLYGVDYTTAGTNENAADNAAAGLVANDGVDDSQLIRLGATGPTPSWDYSGLNKSYHTPRLDPLYPTGNSTTGENYYGGGSGTIDGSVGAAKFAFDPLSDTVPAPIATESAQVVDCVTAKMRYIANIAATTPAGIYTTKINYIAAPQY